MFGSLAEVLHEIITLVPWREEARKLAAHEAVQRELGDGTGAHAAGQQDQPAAPENGSGDQAAAAASTPAASGTTTTKTASDK